MTKVEIVVKYLKCIEDAMQVLRTHFGDVNFQREVVTGNVPRNAEIGNYEFNFHGKGCSVVCPKYEISFNFSGYGTYGGVDAWNLFQFLECTDENVDSYTEDSIKGILNGLLRQGILIKSSNKHDSEQFFLKNPKEFGVNFFEEMSDFTD